MALSESNRSAHFFFSSVPLAPFFIVHSNRLQILKLFIATLLRPQVPDTYPTDKFISFMLFTQFLLSLSPLLSFRFDIDDFKRLTAAYTQTLFSSAHVMSERQFAQLISWTLNSLSCELVLQYFLERAPTFPLLYSSYKVSACLPVFSAAHTVRAVFERFLFYLCAHPGPL